MKLALIGISAVLLSSAPLLGQVVYSNLAPDGWTSFFPEVNNEYGDEIILQGGVQQTINSLTIQYWAQNFSGDEKIRVRFYQNDGVNSQQIVSPSTVLFDSSVLPLPQSNGRKTLTLSIPNVTIPDSITWSVQFSGVTAGESAGLAITDPPTVGQGYPDFWQKVNGEWTIYSTPPDSISFGSEFLAVPEPAATPIAWLGVASIVVAGSRWLKRRDPTPRDS